LGQLACQAIGPFVLDMKGHVPMCHAVLKYILKAKLGSGKTRF
jgi:hypothetical protein